MQQHKRILFVGQAPSRTTRKAKMAFESGRSAERLAELMETTVAGMHERHDFVNLLRRYPGKNDPNHPKGDGFPMKTARRAAERMRPRLAGRTVVLVGKNVQDAFGFDQDFFETGVEFLPRCGAFVHFTMPHPSGVNFWWNDKSNVEKAREFFRKEIYAGSKVQYSSQAAGL